MLSRGGFLLILLVAVLIFSGSTIEALRQHEVELEQDQIELGQEYISLQQRYGELEAELAKERMRVIAGRELHNFESLDELNEFLAEDKTNEHPYTRGVFDCDDFALMLQRNALEKGYLMNCQMLFREHMLNMTIAGDTVYYIEATTDEILFVNYR